MSYFQLYESKKLMHSKLKPNSWWTVTRGFAYKFYLTGLDDNFVCGDYFILDDGTRSVPVTARTGITIDVFIEQFKPV